MVGDSFHKNTSLYRRNEKQQSSKMMIKITKLDTMSYYSSLTSLIKLRSLFFLEEVELGLHAVLVDLVSLGLREYFDSLGADEPWGLLGPKIVFNHLSDVKSYSLSL